MTAVRETSARSSTEPPLTVGRVEAIHIAAAASAPMRSVASVRAIPGVGLEGDRYALRTGHYSSDQKVDREITLVAAEELERLEDAFDIVLEPGATRRNLTTRGIDLNPLVGRRFRIGPVECEATRLCEPCVYLATLVGAPIVEPLVHRGGLRARILTEGEVRVGDEVVSLG